MIQINQQLAIADDELSFSASRSSGPGGQNVNKVNTRVTLWFDVAGSPSLSADQKQALLARLANRITREGMLQVVSQQQVHVTQPYLILRLVGHARVVQPPADLLLQSRHRRLTTLEGPADHGSGNGHVSSPG